MYLDIWRRQDEDQNSLLATHCLTMHLIKIKEFNMFVELVILYKIQFP